MKIWRMFVRAMLRMEIAECERELKKIAKHPRNGSEYEGLTVATQLTSARRRLKAEEQYETDLKTRAHVRRIQL